MKINKFQELAIQTPVAKEALARVGQSKMNQLPVRGTAKFRALIDDIGADLIAASLACEALGVTLEYVAETALEISKHLDLEGTQNEFN